jgi:hypothetical protein
MRYPNDKNDADRFDIDLQNWALEVLDGVNDRVALALENCGWKIVSADDDPNRKWPWTCRNKSWPCPDWCDDGKRPKQTAVVLAFDRDKPDKT